LFLLCFVVLGTLKCLDLQKFGAAACDFAGADFRIVDQQPGKPRGVAGAKR
jgi:hypothetical protein